MKEPEHILFAYSCTPSCGFSKEDDGGFSVEINSNDILVYKTYLFDCIEQTRITMKLSPLTKKEIERILERNAKAIENLSSRLDNGSDDGCSNRFIFSGKEIVSWNIKFTNERLLAVIAPAYYQKYINSIRQENTVLHIFKLVSKNLKHEGVKLTLDNVVLY